MTVDPRIPFPTEVSKPLFGKELQSFLDWKKRVCEGCKWQRTILVTDMQSSKAIIERPRTKLLDATGNVIAGRTRVTRILHCFRELDHCLVINEGIGGYTYEERITANAFFSERSAETKECLCLKERMT